MIYYCQIPSYEVKHRISAGIVMARDNHNPTQHYAQNIAAVAADHTHDSLTIYTTSRSTAALAINPHKRLPFLR
jgi:translation initiation factor 2B subunit (eIF-2B alpha/beta/delta family)